MTLLRILNSTYDNFVLVSISPYYLLLLICYILPSPHIKPSLFARILSIQFFRIPAKFRTTAIEINPFWASGIHSFMCRPAGYGNHSDSNPRPIARDRYKMPTAQNIFGGAQLGGTDPGPNLGIIGPTPGHSLMGHILAAQKHWVSSISARFRNCLTNRTKKRLY